MTTTPAGPTGNQPHYEIRVQGHLGSRWAAWFDGLSVVEEPDGVTALRGPVVDQAALHGVLQRVRDAGLPLLSVTQLDCDHQRSSSEPTSPEGKRHEHDRA